MVLVTGGTGALGLGLARRLIDKGHRVRVLTLPRDPGAACVRALGAETVAGDITRPDTLSAALAGVETLFHLAAAILSPARPQIFEEVNVRGTTNLLRAAEAAGAQHFVYVSSASVAYPKQNAYARSKRKAEEAVRASAIPHFTILRPTLVYDDEGGAEEFRRFVRYLTRYPVVPLIGRGQALKSPVHADDIAQGIAAVAGNAKSYGKSYHLCGPDAVPLRRMAEMILEKMGRPKPFIPVPVALCRLLSRITAGWSRITGRQTDFTWQTISGVTQDAAPDNREAREDLGFSPRSFSVGLTEIAAFGNPKNAKPRGR